MVEAPIDAEGIEEIIGVPMLTADPSEVLEARCALDILVLIRGSVPLRAKRVYEGLSYNDKGEVKGVVWAMRAQLHGSTSTRLELGRAERSSRSRLPKRRQRRSRGYRETIVERF